MQDTINIEYQAKAQLMRKASVVLLISQIVFFFLKTTVLLPEGKTPNLIVFLVFSAPLIGFLPFVIKRNLKAHAWLCYLSLLYFIPFSMNVFDPRFGVIAQLELANIILLFLATMMFTRYEQRRLDITITPKTDEPKL